MGWLWTSSSPESSQPTAPSQIQETLQPTQKPAPPTAAAPPQSQNDPDDAEIQRFLDLLKTDESTSQSTAQKQKNSQESQAPSWIRRFASTNDGPESVPAPVRDAISESLLPTEMSCRQAFDLAWSCNSIGGQWNGVYRQGTMRGCSDQWNDFWFCMRTKSHVGPVKDEMIRAHYRNKEHRKYYAPGGRSSEDVWEARSTKVAPGSVFSESIDMPRVDDEEWRSLESERRNKIRGELGFDKS